MDILDTVEHLGHLGRNEGHSVGRQLLGDVGHAEGLFADHSRESCSDLYADIHAEPSHLLECETCKTARREERQRVTTIKQGRRPGCLSC